MHPTESSLSFVERDVALHHFRVEASILEFPLTPAPSEETPAVVGWLEVDLENAGQLSFLKSHAGDEAITIVGCGLGVVFQQPAR
jgi:hypothetical protein